MVSRNLHFRPEDPGLTRCSLQSWLHPLPYPADWSVIPGVFMREFVNVVIWWWEKEWFNILQIYFAICAMHVRLPDLSGRGILDGDHMNISLFFSNSHRLNSLKEGPIFLYCVPPLFLVKKNEVVLSSAPLINSFWKDASLKLRQMERHGPRPVTLVASLLPRCLF